MENIFEYRTEISYMDEIKFLEQKIRDLKKLLEKKDEEVTKMRETMNAQADPRRTFTEFLEHYTDQHGNQPIRKFRVSYNKTDAPVRGMEIHFANPDNRAKTSAQNGQKGGRPRLENPSQSALAKRNYRESKVDKDNPNLGLSDQEE